MLRRILTFMGFVVLSIAPGTARAQSVLVDLGSGSGVAGTAVLVPVAIESTGGAQPAGLQLDVAFNTSVLTFNQATTGAAATAAGKSVSSGVISPGNLRVVVAGINQTAIGNGVVAVLQFTIAGGVTTSTTPLSVSGVRVTDPQAQLVVSTAGNGLVVIAGGISNPSQLFFAQVADGGGFKTTLLLVNTGNTEVTALLELFSQNGTGMLFNMSGNLDNAFLFTLPAKGLKILESSSINATTQAGWARLRSSGPMGGSVVYAYSSSPGTIVSEAGILPSAPTAGFGLAVDTRRARLSGLAVANPNLTGVTLVLTLFNGNGVQLRQETKTLAALNQLALLMGGAGQLFDGVDFSSFTGVVAVTSTGGQVIATTLRFSANLAIFTSIPVI